MDTKLTRCLAFVMLTATFSFTSCNNDEAIADNSTITNPENISAQREAAQKHSMTIVNNSRYDLAVSRYNAQSNYDLFDPIEIYHEPKGVILLRAGKSVTFYDYKMVSDPNFKIDSWNVINHTYSRDAAVMELSSTDMAAMYGMLSDPTQPRSDRYPVFNRIEARVYDSNGKALIPMTGNNDDVASLRYLGNLDQGYNSQIVYGRILNNNGEHTSVIPNDIYPAAILKWKQAYVDGVRNTGEITITLENAITR